MAARLILPFHQGNEIKMERAAGCPSWPPDRRWAVGDGPDLEDSGRTRAGGRLPQAPSWARWGPWGEEGGDPHSQAGPARPPLPAPRVSAPPPSDWPARERTRVGPTGDGNGVGDRWDPRSPVPGPRWHPRLPLGCPRPPSMALRRPALPGAWRWTLKTQKGWTSGCRALELTTLGGPEEGPWRGRSLWGVSGWGRGGAGARGREHV